MNIFINYRRADSPHQADRLYSGLAKYLEAPDEQLYMDIEDTPLGINYINFIAEKISECDIFLALIGEKWFAIDDAKTKTRRLENPDDLVRVEIKSALARTIPVVPTLFDTADLPAPSDLPEDINELPHRNGFRIVRPTFEEDVERLAKLLGLPGENSKKGVYIIPPIFSDVWGNEYERNFVAGKEPLLPLPITPPPRSPQIVSDSSTIKKGIFAKLLKPLAFLLVAAVGLSMLAAYFMKVGPFEQVMAPVPPTIPPTKSPIIDTASAKATLDVSYNPSGSLNVGDTINYTVTASNTGEIPIDDLVMSSAGPIMAFYRFKNIQPGEIREFSDSHKISDAGNGTETTTFTLTSVDLRDPITKTLTINNIQALPINNIQAVPPNRELSIQTFSYKLEDDNDQSGTISLGDRISALLEVKNTGDETEDLVVMGSDGFSPELHRCQALAPNELCTYTSYREISELNSKPGNFIVTAFAISEDAPRQEKQIQIPIEEAVMAKASLNVDYEPRNGLRVGDSIEYRITASNTGEIPITNPEISSSGNISASHQCPRLMPGESCPILGNYTISEVGNGSLKTIFKLTSPDLSAPITELLTIKNIQALPKNRQLSIRTFSHKLEVDNDQSGTISLGDEVSVNLEVENTGDTTEKNAIISIDYYESKGAPQTCPELAPKDVCEMSSNHTINEFDDTRGKATFGAYAKLLNGPEETEGQEISVETVVADAKLEVSYEPTDNLRVGDTIEYTVKASNTGNIPIKSLDISSSGPIQVSEQCGTVKPGESCERKGTHKIDKTDNGILKTQLAGTSADLSDQIIAILTINNIQALPKNRQLSIHDISHKLTADNDKSGKISVGDKVSVYLRVTNTGDAIENNVIIGFSVSKPSPRPLGAKIRDHRDVKPRKRHLGAKVRDHRDVLKKGDTIKNEVIKATTSSSGLEPSSETCLTLAPKEVCRLSSYYIISKDDDKMREATITAYAESADVSRQTKQIKIPVPVKID